MTTTDVTTTDDLTTVLLADMAQAARLAPSVHNSQPWRFATRPGSFDVYADQTRAAPVIDPHGRWLLMSCGAAVFNAALAARAGGRDCQVSISPDLGPVATLTLGRSEPSSAQDSRLLRAVPERHTMREPFGPVPVTDQLVDELRRAAEDEGAWLSVLRRPEDVIELAVLTSTGEAAELDEVAYQRELASWLRQPGMDASDGIPVEILAGEVRGSDLPLRSFVPADASAPPPEVEHPLLVVIGTDADTKADWVRAGMAMQRVLLTATAAGLSGSPMTQALDQPISRSRLSHLLGVADAHPQMVLRLGYGTATATTGRRPIGDLMTVTA